MKIFKCILLRTKKKIKPLSNWSTILCCSILHATILAPSTFAASNASGTATASIKILSALKIEKISDLVFPDAVKGDGPYTIPAGNADNSMNASFLVTGEPFAVFSIILPTNGEVIMTLNSVAQESELASNGIRVNNFTSTPKYFGLLSKVGASMLYVGASRDKIPETLPSGQYFGTFKVTVSY